MIFLWFYHMLFITSFLCLHFYLNHHNIFFVQFLFLKFSWISIQNKCFSSSWITVFLVLEQQFFNSFLSVACLLFYSISLKNLFWFILRFLFLLVTNKKMIFNLRIINLLISFHNFIFFLNLHKFAHFLMQIWWYNLLEISADFVIFSFFSELLFFVRFVTCYYYYYYFYAFSL